MIWSFNFLTSVTSTQPNTTFFDITFDLSIFFVALFAIIAFIVKNYQKTKITLRDFHDIGESIPFYDSDNTQIQITNHYLIASFTFLNASNYSTSLIDFHLDLIDKNKQKLEFHIPLRPGYVYFKNKNKNEKLIINIIPPFDYVSFVIPPKERITREFLIGYNNNFSDIKKVEFKFTIAENTIFYPFKKTRSVRFRNLPINHENYLASNYYFINKL